MTPYLQFRLWLREAASAERWTALAAGVIVVALIGWALVPARHHRAVSALAAGSAAGATPGTAAGTAAGTAPALADGSTAAAPGATGAGPSATGAGGGPSGGPAALTKGTGSGTSTSGGSSSAPVLTASDRGVTPTSVKVGFTILNLAGVSQAGIAANLRTDISDVIDAVVDHYNKAGGILGRTILPDKVSVDIINTDDQRAKCLQLTETDKVFAVVDTIEYVFRAARACFPVEHQTPLVTFIPGGSDEVAKAFPLQVSPGKDYSRVMKDYVMGAQAEGFFDPAKGFKKLGLLDDDCDPKVIDDPNDGLKAYLRQIGITSWSEFRVGCAIDEQEREPPQGAVQHRTDGVTNVMFVTTHLAIEPYMNAAQGQAWHPAYYLSDYEGVTADVASNKLPADQADRVHAVSQYYSGDPMKQATVVACNKILTDHGLAPITSYNHDFEAIDICENAELFVRAAIRAGPNLTRTGWGNAVQGIGDLAGTITNLGRFNKQGKITGGDTIATAEWRRECSCWARISDFRAAYG
jgi:hypothetical protein